MTAAKTGKTEREKRLAEQLRINLRRRKNQSKERKAENTEEASSTDSGIAKQ